MFLHYIGALDGGGGGQCHSVDFKKLPYCPILLLPMSLITRPKRGLGLLYRGGSLCRHRLSYLMIHEIFVVPIPFI